MDGVASLIPNACHPLLSSNEWDGVSWGCGDADADGDAIRISGNATIVMIIIRPV